MVPNQFPIHLDLGHAVREAELGANARSSKLTRQDITAGQGLFAGCELTNNFVPMGKWTPDSMRTAGENS